MNRKKLKIYFASPLFTDMERDYNKNVVDKIRFLFPNTVDVYLPQENDAINDKSGYADSQMIAIADTKELLEADLVIAVLDGITIDAGVASEIGIAYQHGIDIIGLYTDSRQGTFGNKDKIKALDIVAESQFSYINLYTVGLIKSAFGVHKFVLDNHNDGIAQDLDSLLDMVTYFVNLKKYESNHVYHFFNILSNGFVFNVEFESSIEKTFESFSEKYFPKVGSELILLSKRTFTSNPNREINKAYRDYLINPDKYETYIVEDKPKYPAIVTGYHYNTIGDVINLNHSKEFHFYATDELADDIGLGDTVIVDTVRGSQKLLVTRVRDSKTVDYKPTKNVIEILRKTGN